MTSGEQPGWGVPLGRARQAQEIANGVLVLASDASNYMTGRELVIEGGMTGGTPTALDLRLARH